MPVQYCRALFDRSLQITKKLFVVEVVSSCFLLQTAKRLFVVEIIPSCFLLQTAKKLFVVEDVVLHRQNLLCLFFTSIAFEAFINGA